MNPNTFNANNDNVNNEPSEWDNLEGTGTESEGYEFEGDGLVKQWNEEHQKELEERGITEAEWQLETRDRMLEEEMNDPVLKELFTQDDGTYDEAAHREYAEKQVYGAYGGRDNLTQNASTGGETGMEGDMPDGTGMEG